MIGIKQLKHNFILTVSVSVSIARELLLSTVRKRLIKEKRNMPK